MRLGICDQRMVTETVPRVGQGIAGLHEVDALAVWLLSRNHPKAVH